MTFPDARRSTPASLLSRLAALVALMALTGVLTFGYLGWLHMAFDSFSHFRVHAGVMLILFVPLLLVLRFRPEALFALVLGGVAIFHTTGLPYVGGPLPVSASATTGSGHDHGGAVYRLLHLNLRYDNHNRHEALSLFGRLQPDVVTLNEVSQPWVETLRLVEAAYPYRLICPPPSPIGGVAILSRRPFAADFEPRCGDRGSFGHVRLDLGGRTVEVATLHLGWPWPFAQPWQLPRIAPLLGDIGGTAIIAADLNATPWSHAARRIEAASDARILRGIGPTWLDRRLPEALRPWIGLPIDNALVKGGVLPVGLGTVDGGGSDHLPVLLEFIVLPEEKPAEVLRAALGE